MEDLSLHILDIAENSIAAGAKTIEILVREDTVSDVLTVEVADDGKGMDAKTAEKATEPFFTTRTTRRVGLGLAFLKEAAEATNGSLRVESSPSHGTRVCATFQLSHIDRKPLGNTAETILTLLTNDSGVDVVYTRQYDNRNFVFDTREFLDHLHGMPLSSTASLKIIREFLKSEEHTVTNQA